jgi:type II secretory pathway pseudopilin PulG
MNPRIPRSTRSYSLWGGRPARRRPRIGPFPRSPRCSLRRRARAFSMFELLIYLVLLSAFALLAAQLYTLTANTSRDASRAQDSLNRLDVVLARLRADAWRAQTIRVVGEKQVDLVLPDGQTVTWTMTAKDLTRSLAVAGKNDERPAVWPNMRPAWSFAEHGPALLVSIASPDKQAPAQFLLVSQPLLAGRLQP